MGIPKFFRFMSERYPLISQLVEENKIPEFDNLYLDMNGIIHSCSHPNDGDAHFRITEADIFLGVFSYIEHIFAKIKPRKLFFLAIDGVAPRAKMNQQRSRRFRTAKETKEVRNRAIAKGEELPEEEAFDSNCITPGTPFMARLSAQLKYFLAKKLTEDASWRGVQVVLSGHETPGEGEHKVMEYIRLAKAQPDYNPNVRHCLYGLDADLIMLGLLSHDPHFALLREEVNFGPQRKKRTGLESQNFYLLHLSLFREYLDLEFQDLRSSLPFDYSLERIIDDFILLNIFVGNDFLPHLPGLHINEGALPMLFRIYKNVLPTAGGYLNEDGVLQVGRLQLVLAELAKLEVEQFKAEFADSSWYEGKEGPSEKERKKRAQANGKGKLVLTPSQKALYDKVKRFVLAQRADPVGAPADLFLASAMPMADQTFLKGLCKNLGFALSFDEYDPDADAPATAVSSELDEQTALILMQDKIAAARFASATDQVLSKYDKAQVLKEETNGLEEQEEEDDEEAAEAKMIEEKMLQWKKDYYHDKLHIDFHDKAAMRQLAFKYVEGLQWVLHYYYDGVASWGWFYPYHYAPKISDLLPVFDMKFEFQLGKPFRPFDQLMGVLPALSRQHIPPAFRDLMTDPTSSIIDFYPPDFEADMNGKKQDWEAVVKIPFIDEKRLLAALDKREGLLTADEKQRNSFGESTRLTFDEHNETFFASSLPGVFPDLPHSRAKVEAFHLPTLDGLHLVRGLCDGVQLGSSALAGFPSLKTLPHFGRTEKHGVNVFQSESRLDSVVLHVENRFDRAKSEDLASAILGRRTFTHWPFLYEGMVTALSDSLFKYELVNGHVTKTPHAQDALLAWRRKADRLEQHYSKRYGVLVGRTEQLLHVRPLIGLKRLEDGSFVKEYEVDAAKEVEQLLQMSIADVVQEDSRTLERSAQELSIEYPLHTRLFFLGDRPYGAPAAVVQSQGSQLTIELAYYSSQAKENAYIHNLVASRTTERYYPAFSIAKKVGMSSLALSKITSSMLLDHNGSRTNVGLNLKFEAKSCKVLGYSRKGVSGWEFSDKAIELINSFKLAFPEISNTIAAKAGADLRDAQDFFGEKVEERMKDIKKWIKDRGVRDLEAVPLFAEQLDKQTVGVIESFTTSLLERVAKAGPGAGIKRAHVKGMPRNALLKPSHAPYRLQGQRFELGDRVIYALDTGTVPLSARGVVVGLNSTNIDVLFDIPFLSGTRLGDRCSPHRGATVTFDSVLNLTQPQFAVGSTAQNPSTPTGPSKARSSAGDYRPPNMLRAAKQAQPNGHHVAQQQGAPTAILSRNARPTRPPSASVTADYAFSGVASGTAKPSSPSATNAATQGLNPHLAALSIRGGSAAARGRGRGSGRGGGPNGPSRGRGAAQRGAHGAVHASVHS